ncbi:MULTISPECIES: ATP-binding cassette domain-containing protein [Haloferax]|uniref:ATP-binding cassette domain-containing protein n=2 Tax=Haloferax TaxID=2251 RepID=A0A6G1Z6E9_9EURY|nr:MULTISPECIES: ATP-binding cassette domain-containing protein [Haloferax]KAB1185334.1 sugar ABC transporter ATP-binding protein [Haloferax sp. CBA1149]MRW81971.1 ATP-binding cassette domain-containing protein [Haloferax marinisediminis]
MTTDTPKPRIEVEHVQKRFGTVEALSDVTLTLEENEVLGLVGDNGAGKSTFIKTLVGIHQPDGGEIRFEGEPVTIEGPKHARKLGIGTVYQDLALVDELSVAENLFLGRMPVKKLGGVLPIVDREYMAAEAERILSEHLNIHVDPDTPVEYLSGGERQAVAIGRALVTDPDIVLLDEPTSALSKAAVDHVEELVEQLRESGHSVILIDHNLEEVLSMTDRIAVLFQGRIVDVVDSENITRDDVVSMMVSGHSLQDDDSEPDSGDTVSRKSESSSSSSSTA